LSIAKHNIVFDLQQKKSLSSREELIQNLKEKMTKSNTMVSEYDNMSSYMVDMESKRVFYDQSTDTYLNSQEDSKKMNRENQDLSKRAYLRDLKEVIQNSDVILEVLDARDPLSCKSNELEELVRSHKDEKKIIVILNKIDLIPS
jgi:nuclear GTP-binding protein